MDLPSEVGLRLLLSPMGSSVVLRTACSTNLLYVQSNRDERSERAAKMAYLLGSLWIFQCCGSVLRQSLVLDAFILPFEVCLPGVAATPTKLCELLSPFENDEYTFLLKSTQGAKGLYDSHLRPFLLRRQARLDKIVDHVYTGMNNFVSAHEGEIRIVRALSLRLVASVRDCIHPVQREPTVPAIEAPRRSLSDSPSEDEDFEDEDEDDYEEGEGEGEAGDD